MIEKERERQRSLPKHPRQPEWGQAEDRSPELIQGLPHGWQGLKYLNYDLLPSRVCVRTRRRGHLNSGTQRDVSIPRRGFTCCFNAYLYRLLCNLLFHSVLYYRYRSMLISCILYLGLHICHYSYFLYYFKQDLFWLDFFVVSYFILSWTIWK